LELFGVPLDVNAATEAELASLPGVGQGLAARIAEARPFSTVEEVGRVKGLGEKRFQALRARLRLHRR
jgi:DNA uptake protein ComE-like DNA-binding protein